MSSNCQCVQESNMCSIGTCHHHFNLDLSTCKCNQNFGPTCRKGCPPGQKIYGIPGKINCKCEDKVTCPITSCKGPAKLVGCECKAPPQNMCLIQKCHPYFDFNSSNCSCNEKMGAICLIGCPPGKKVYAVPGKINCKCENIIKCPIQSCKASSQLVNCQCQKKSSKTCPIKKCKRFYKLNKKCLCRRQKVTHCKRRCPKGFGHHPRTCRCIRRPKCPIRKCKPGFKLNRKKCRCIKRKKSKSGRSGGSRDLAGTVSCCACVRRASDSRLETRASAD